AEVSLDHVRQSGARAIKSAVEIGIEDLGPVIVGHLANAFVASDAGIVYKNVDPLVSAEYFLNHVSSFESVRHVALEDLARASKMHDLISDFFCSHHV